MNDSQGTQAQFVATTFATANEWDCATAATVASSGSKWIEWESSSIRDAKDFHFSLRKKWNSSEMESWKFSIRIWQISISVHPVEL
jgi:hypothetical protein